MILVLAGPVHSGKTSLLRHLLPDLEALEVPVCGYLSLAVRSDGEIIGYDLFDIKKGRSLPFLRTEGEDAWQKVGPYFILPSGLKAAEAAILGRKPGERLIVDEVGPLEFSGQGVWPALSRALDRFSFDGLLVTRKTLLKALRDRLGFRPVKVFYVGREDVQPALLKALSEKKRAE
jgi:nucleoside-triphosphatase THEP1